MKKVIGILFLLFVSATIADETPVVEAPVPVPIPVAAVPVEAIPVAEAPIQAPVPAAPDKTPVATENSVFIIICDEKPGQAFVLDSTGKWLSTVRDVTISFTIGQKVPSVICTLWSGPFKPSNPEVKAFELMQLKSVTNAEFQSMIDALQTDPDAISRQITE